MAKKAKKEWPPKEEFIAFLEREGLTTPGKYARWRRENPSEAARWPASPHGTYAPWSWRSIGEDGHAARCRLERPVGEFIAFLSSINAVTPKEYAEWRRANPEEAKAWTSSPYRTYEGWSWGRVGRTNLPPRQNWPKSKATFIAFLEANGLYSKGRYGDWRKVNPELARNYPSNPRDEYPSWSWRDVRRWRPYPEAKAFARTLGFQSIEEWHEWAKGSGRPHDIPSAPSAAYEEFEGYPEFLGYERRGGHEYLPFAEARAIVRALGLRTHEEWLAWARSALRPSNIPVQPHTVYGDEWAGLADWLGTTTRWTPAAILATIKELKDELPNLTTAELYRVLEEGGFLNRLRHVLGKKSILEALHELVRDPDGVAEAVAADADFGESDPTDENDFADTDLEAAFDADRTADLGLLDRLSGTLVWNTLGEDTIEHLVRVRVGLLWDTYVSEGEEAAFALIENPEGEWIGRIARRFREEVEAVRRIETPAAWAFADPDTGEPFAPNAMQKRTAWAVSTKKRVGNWSGVGAGKTVAALLASRVCDTRFTVVLAANATVAQWAATAPAVFPDSVVHTEVPEEIDRSRFTYLVLNYEKLQLESSEERVRKIAALRPDFVVLDEVQFVKQRDGHASKRRRHAELLLDLCSENPDLRVLGMSATPVINNLTEATKLLELVTGEEPPLKTHPSVRNALRVHEALMEAGFRYVPRYAQEFPVTFVPTEADTSLVCAMVEAAGERHALPMEQCLLPAKLEAARPYLKRGTVLYTHYVSGMVEPIRAFVEAQGLSVALYTGDEKGGLDAFRAGEADVLVASQPLATGVDGLQRVSNRLLILSLPWTGALYEQLVGRLRRQGSAFRQGEVIVPQVVAEVDGERWSWDERRWRVVEAKRTLADCAVDGVVPDTIEITEGDFMRLCREALERWRGRVAQLSLAA